MLQSNLTVGTDGHLYLAGQDTVALAARYGTPLYLLDEARVRENCRLYVRALRRELGEGGGRALFASKALCIKALYPILREEGLGADVVSVGEIRTALAAGFPAQDIYFHGNNKLPEEIAYALEQRIGCFIVDHEGELERLEQAAAARGVCQDVLLRLTPGIDPHTFDAVNTGKIDCQFGVPIETGQAEGFVLSALQCGHLRVRGYHCHIGSQIFDGAPYERAAQIMLDFAARIRARCGYTPEILNLGGGVGVRYRLGDPQADIDALTTVICRALRRLCEERALPCPHLLLEPGRSIVADAGITLYTAGAVKRIDGYRQYVMVDGGMSDNPRYALYGAPYTVLLANRADERAQELYTVAGRCCETGALIQENVPLPAPRAGDLVAVLATGAYNYSMASNYNRLGRPAMVLLSGGESRVIARRETWEDMTAREL